MPAHRIEQHPIHLVRNATAAVWHTADVEGEATAVFVTVGVGTQNRPRTT